MSTILEEAVARGVKITGPGGAEAQILKLLRQVGQLEERNAALENGIKAISARCYWRRMGYCDLSCPGRVFCDVTGLAAFDFSKLHRDTPGPCPFPIEGQT
jgi:hypothetical protein